MVHRLYASAVIAAVIVTTAAGSAFSQTLYIAGYFMNDDQRMRACYWKNDTRIELRDGLIANWIQVSGQDVYCAGSYYREGMKHHRACYWKNGQVVPLTVPGDEMLSEANSIQVSGGDIYICGDYGTHPKSTPLFWKNGELTAPAASGTAFNCVYHNGDVYIAGRDGDNRRGFWKNGLFTAYDIPPGDNARALVLDGGDVYMPGWHTGSKNQSACYWKNGSRVDLLTGADASLLQMIVRSGSIYALGYYNTGGTVWRQFTMKDGRKTDIPQLWRNVHIPAAHSDTKKAMNYREEQKFSAQSFALYGDRLYVAGNIAVSPYQSGTDVFVWDGGKMTFLKSGKNAGAKHIVAVP